MAVKGRYFTFVSYQKQFYFKSFNISFNERHLFIPDDIVDWNIIDNPPFGCYIFFVLNYYLNYFIKKQKLELIHYFTNSLNDQIE